MLTQVKESFQFQPQTSKFLQPMWSSLTNYWSAELMLVWPKKPKYIRILLQLQLILNVVVMMTLADLLQLLLLHSALGNLGLAVIFNVFKSHALGSLNWKAQCPVPNQLHIQQRVKQAVNKYSQIADGINSLWWPTKKISSNVVVTVIASHHLLPDLKCAEHDHFKPVLQPTWESTPKDLATPNSTV